MRMVYLGDDFEHSTSTHRREALKRLGHDVVALNPRDHVPSGRWVSGLNVRTGFRLFAPWVGYRLRRRIERLGGPRIQVAWIDGAPELPPSLYPWLKRRGILTVNYNVDDPFGRRDRRKWDLYLRSVCHHDLTVVVRAENVAEARQWRSPRVLRVYRSYDPVAHAPVELTADERRTWAEEVVFLGTWMPERGPLMARLLDLGVPLALRGDLWPKAAEWPRLRPYWRGPAVYGKDYVRAIMGAKVALGLLSKGNRDLHTTRSAEVPFAGGAVFCAERTDEHLRLFVDGEHAVLWSSAEECAEKCRQLLAEPERLRRMAAAAKQRIVDHRLSNDEVLAQILGHLPAA